MQFTTTLYSTIQLVLRMSYATLYSNINLGPLMTALIFAIGIKASFGIAEFVVFLFKAWKSLVPVLGA